MTIVSIFKTTVVLGVVLLSGCASLSPFSGIANPPQEPKKIATYAQTEKQVPLRIGVTPEGKDVIAFQTERTYTAGSTETREKLGFMQRVGRWIGGLGLLSIIFIVVSLAFFGGAPILWAFSKYMKMKSAFIKVVAGVEELKKVDAVAQEKLTKTILANTMDTPEKDLVKAIKLKEL